MTDKDADRGEALAELERLIDEGHEDAERHGALTPDELDRWLEEARAERSGATPVLLSSKPRS